MRIAPLFWSLALLAGCNGDGANGGGDSAFACDCPAINAADVEYDNSGSGLADTNLQDAVDELAARPDAPVDAYTRIITVEDPIVADAPGGWSRTVTCPGSPPNVAIAMGGACDGGDADTVVQGTQLQASAFQCNWRYEGAGSVTLTAQVTCLMPAEVQ